MTGHKAPPGADGVLPKDADAAIEAKEAREEHWRRSGALRAEEDDAPLGSKEPGVGERRPPAPTE